MNYGITTYIYGASPLSLKYTDEKLDVVISDGSKNPDPAKIYRKCKE